MTKILELRSQMGVRQEDIARAAGCSQRTISSYERGISGIDHLIRFKRIADYFGCTLEDLLIGFEGRSNDRQ